MLSVQGDSGRCFDVDDGARSFERDEGDAAVGEIIPANPCVVKRGELPRKMDKDPTWRPGAVFTRDEVEALISDERIPEDRRVLYALEFLAGMRSGEAAALLWRAYDAKQAPLGRLLVANSYNSRSKTVKSTKTERPREVPVHTTLAKLLAAWKLSGWRRLFGESPAPDDLIVPACGGGNRNVSYSLKAFHEDLERIGLRLRRHYDTRRTFISLAQADGARKDVLRWVTHGPTGDIVDAYTTLPWATLCEAVSCLRIAVNEGKVLQLRAASERPAVGDGLETDASTPGAEKEKARRTEPSGL